LNEINENLKKVKSELPKDVTIDVALLNKDKTIHHCWYPPLDMPLNKERDITLGGMFANIKKDKENQDLRIKELENKVEKFENYNLELVGKIEHLENVIKETIRGFVTK
jgi:hypothetical protein